jgi:hypothetical protein
MNGQFRIPSPETRVKSTANLKVASRLLDLCYLELDEAIAMVDKDLREQKRARLLYGTNSIPTNKIESYVFRSRNRSK